MHKLVVISLSLLSLFSILIADEVDDAIDEYQIQWQDAGNEYSIEPTSTIYVDITNIPSVFGYWEGSNWVQVQSIAADDTSFVDATFNRLLLSLKTKCDSLNCHGQIMIPAGTYNLRNQLLMFQNLSLKGDGSESTTLRFVIQTGNIMDSTACNKDAILIKGTQDDRICNVGIENLKIIRERVGVSREEVYRWVYGMREHAFYSGNNIAIINANNCWIKGVHSEDTFRNHVTMQQANHVTISGVYFHSANKFRGGGFGYGVGLWESSSNLICNSIFDFLRHGVTVEDGSKYNVISYNYFVNQHSTESAEEISGFTQQLLNIVGQTDVTTSPRGDIAIHGESANCYPSSSNPYLPERKPMYNLIEGNCLRSLEVDGTHQENGEDNTFLRNRVKGQIHVHGKAGYTDVGIAWAMATLATLLPDPSALTRTWLLILFPSITETCVDCVALRLADGDAFKNQPSQLFVNNYARERNWWRSQFQDYPLRMHSEISQFQANTLKDYATWWGGVQQKTVNPDTSFVSDVTYYCVDSNNCVQEPDFWPDETIWPYQYLDDPNPAQLRKEVGGKLAVGEGETGFVSITSIDNDETISSDIEIVAGGLLVVKPGVTVKFAPGKGIIAHGAVRIGKDGGAPVVMTCSDPSQTWDGIRLIQESASSSLPNLEISNCELSLSDSRAIYLKDYSTATIDSCRIVNNSGKGGIYSENGSIHIESSFIGNNTLSSSSNQYGAGLYLKNTNAEIVNTYFVDNTTDRLGGSALHIAADTDTTRSVDLYNCYFHGNTGDNYAFQGWGLHVDDLTVDVPL